MATITDKRIQHSSDNTTTDYFMPDVVAEQEYYAFGALMPGRSVNTAGYRYGFNGKENDNDVGKGTGNQQDYGMRIYDPRIGKFLSLDPISPKYPELTPYQFASNRPIDGIDQDGKEWMSCIYIYALAHAKSENPGIGDYISATGDVFSMAMNDLGNSLKRAAYSISGAELMGDTYTHMKEYQVSTVNHMMNDGNRYQAAIRSGDNPNDVTLRRKFDKTSAALKLVKDAVGWVGFSIAGADASLNGMLINSDKMIVLGSSKGLWGEMKSAQQLGKFKVLEVKVDLNWADAGDRNFFWSEYNKPFLDDVITKGGKFKVVDDVNNLNLLYYGGDPANPTFFGREVDYLRSKGYKFEGGYAVPKK